MAIRHRRTAPGDVGSRGLRATAPEPPPAQPRDLSPRELLRWTWRQLTSMRTALILLFLLALAGDPRLGDPADQRRLAADLAVAGRAPDARPRSTHRLGLFDVFGSFWFAAIYLLLVVSLVGCILPRTMVYWRGLRASRPRPRAGSTGCPSTAPSRPPPRPRTCSAAARRTLRTAPLPAALLDRGRRRRPTRSRPSAATCARPATCCSTSRCWWCWPASGSARLFGFKGGVVIVTGDGFANTLSSYDDFTPGKLFDPTKLSPFSFDVDKFHVTFIEKGRSAGGGLGLLRRPRRPRLARPPPGARRRSRSTTR